MESPIWCDSLKVDVYENSGGIFSMFDAVSFLFK